MIRVNEAGMTSWLLDGDVPKNLCALCSVSARFGWEEEASSEEDGFRREDGYSGMDNSLAFQMMYANNAGSRRLILELVQRTALK